MRQTSISDKEINTLDDVSIISILFLERVHKTIKSVVINQIGRFHTTIETYLIPLLSPCVITTPIAKVFRGCPLYSGSIRIEKNKK
jgi:hypothetical protein